jgi:hypothetical protein
MVIVDLKKKGPYPLLMNLKTMEPQDFGITAKGTGHQATSFGPNFR